MRQLKSSVVAIILLLVTQRAFSINGDDCIQNFLGDYTCASIIFEPSTLEELQNAVKEAWLEKKKVRVFGGLHSAISDVAIAPKNYLIDIAKLDQILDINMFTNTIKVQAGVNLHTLSQQLAKLGLELIDQPGPYDVTVGGMVANGSHGSGMHGCLSDSIVEIEIVDGLGNLQKISADSHPEWLSAARVSLGVLGAIYSVTFQCYPAGIRHVVAEYITTTQAFLNNIPSNLENNQNFQFLINPYSGKILKQTFNEISDASCSNNTIRNFKRYLAQSEIMSELSNVLNPITPTSAYDGINDAIITSGLTNVLEFFYKSYSYYHENRASRARIAEIAVDADRIVPALKKLFKIVNRYKNHDSKFMIMVEVRYVHDSEFTLLSPSRSDRPSWMIGVVLIYPWETEDATAFLQDVSDTLKEAPFYGRPSWGNNPEFLTFNDTKQLYGADNVAAFNAVRKQLDPQGIFYTSYFKQRLGPQ